MSVQVNQGAAKVTETTEITANDSAIPLNIAPTPQTVKSLDNAPDSFAHYMANDNIGLFNTTKSVESFFVPNFNEFLSTILTTESLLMRKTQYERELSYFLDPELVMIYYSQLGYYVAMKSMITRGHIDKQINKFVTKFEALFDVKNLPVDPIAGSFFATLNNANPKDDQFKPVGPLIPSLNHYDSEANIWKGLYNFLLPNTHFLHNAAIRVRVGIPKPGTDTHNVVYPSYTHNIFEHKQDAAEVKFFDIESWPFRFVPGFNSPHPQWKSNDAHHKGRRPHAPVINKPSSWLAFFGLLEDPSWFRQLITAIRSSTDPES